MKEGIKRKSKYLQLDCAVLKSEQNPDDSEWYWGALVVHHRDLLIGGCGLLGPPLAADVCPIQLSIAPIRPENFRLREQRTEASRPLALLRHISRTTVPMWLFVLPDQGTRWMRRVG